MVIKTEQDNTKKDIEVFITYPQKTQFVERLITVVKSVDTQVKCFSNGMVNIVDASEIDYIESVDNKVIVHCEKNIFEAKGPLYQIYEKLKNIKFIQVNKYCILNLNKLKEIKQLPNSHLEAVLKNGKQLYVTRKYLTDLKNTLREIQ